MRERTGRATRRKTATNVALRPECATSNHDWSFVYIFFTNGTPFDAPNRSEPCPPF